MSSQGDQMTDANSSPLPAAPAPSEPPLSGLRKWALIAEVIAAAGVIVSLVFVGIQVMQSNTLAREAAEQKQIESIGALSRIIAESPYLSEAISKSTTGEALTPGELVAITSMETYAQRTWEALYFQYRAGRVDPEVWEAHRDQARAIQSGPLSKSVWQRQRTWYSKSYRDFRERDDAREPLSTFPNDAAPQPAAPQPATPEQAAPLVEAPKQ
jgi:hypothetical protein